MDKLRRLCRWNGYPRSRTAVAVCLTLTAVAWGFAVSWTLEGMLLYGPLGLAAIAVATAVAPPGRRMAIALTSPLAFGGLGAFGYAAGAAAFGVELLTFWLLRKFGLPWDDTTQLRRVAFVVAVGCGVAMTAMAVLELR